MIEVYLAPSYRGCEIIGEPFEEGNKKYLMVNFKGSQKKVRCYDKPQASWASPGDPIRFNNGKGYLTPESDWSYYDPCGGPSLAETLKFGDKGYIWMADCYGLYKGQILDEYIKKHGRGPLKMDIIGIFCGADEKPTIPGISFFRVDKDKILLDDNTYLPKPQIWSNIHELRGLGPIDTNY